MKQELLKFFASNPNATECHVCLGYLHDTLEAAQDRLKGVADVAVKTYTKAQTEAIPDLTTAAPASSSTEAQEVTLNWRSLEEIEKIMDAQKEVVENKVKELETLEGDAADKCAIDLKAECDKLEAIAFAYELKLEESWKK